jgi:3-hydroxyacyl-CoA dehydrogenase
VSALPSKVAIIGTGDIGRGWAALCAAAGWPVTMFDTDGERVEQALLEVPRRAHALVSFERARRDAVETGLRQLQHGRSLLQAVRDADWVIEAVDEDLQAKQTAFERIEEVAAAQTLLTSSTSGLTPNDVFGRCRVQGRCLVAHPLNPPELVPLVELVPTDFTDPAAMQRADAYLRGLGRFPIALKRAVPGFVVGRIAAAVWRECIDLVLQDVIDVDNLDRAVSLGPALGWAAAGPHLTYHLSAEQGGVQIFLQRLLTSFEAWWSALASWDKLEAEQQYALIQLIERCYQEKIGMLREARDRRLNAILHALEEARTNGAG